MKISVHAIIQELKITKGKLYCKLYHNKNSWFYNKNLFRKFVISVNYAREGHYYMPKSLKKINIVMRNKRVVEKMKILIMHYGNAKYTTNKDETCIEPQ